MFELILQGFAPTEVFTRMMAAEPGLRTLDLAQRFVDHFERVEGIAMQVILSWRAPGSERPLGDETVNKWLLNLLRSAGYAISMQNQN